MRAMLEREARKQLLTKQSMECSERLLNAFLTPIAKIEPPMIVSHKDKTLKDVQPISRAANLYRNPAI